MKWQGVQEGGDVYTCDLIHIDEWQKTTQHCKAGILQLKIKRDTFVWMRIDLLKVEG